MKTDTIVIIAVAAIGLFVISRTVKAGTMGGGTLLKQSNKVNAVSNTALPGQPGWGWDYFNDGTAIGPDGKYYFQGQEVYDPNGILKAWS